MSGAVELEARITSYLSLGGLFNPEMMNHDEVRRLLIDCRAELATLRSDNERLGRERDAILKRAQTAEQWLREANFLIREHKSACADAISQAQAAEAERDTLLAQVEAMRGDLEKRAEWHKCSCPEPCDDYGVFPGGCAGRYREDYLSLMLSASPLGTPEGGAK